MKTYDVYEQRGENKSYIGSVKAPDISAATDKALSEFGAPIDIIKQP